jgi:energy-coupling factor transporter transmembrane protein EcfT
MVEKPADEPTITAKLVVTLIIFFLAIFYVFVIAGIAVILIIFFILWLRKEITSKNLRNGDKKIT